MKTSSDLSGLRYLLDTNIISALVKAPAGQVQNRLAELSPDSVAISIISASELRYGLAKKGSQRLAKQVNAILDAISILPLESPVDHHYGEIRWALQSRGLPIGHNDLLIAAHARALDVVLVTANIREFARVPGLMVENWLTAD